MKNKHAVNTNFQITTWRQNIEDDNDVITLTPVAAVLQRTVEPADGCGRLIGYVSPSFVVP
jgi:hypothetical protein